MDSLGLKFTVALWFALKLVGFSGLLIVALSSVLQVTRYLLLNWSVVFLEPTDRTFPYFPSHTPNGHTHTHYASSFCGLFISQDSVSALGPLILFSLGEPCVSVTYHSLFTSSQLCP